MKKDNTLRKLPDFLRRYFWDIDFSTLDIKRSPQYVIERILECGDIDAVQWMINNFTIKKIKKVVCEASGLNPRNATFWALVFGISKRKVRCLKKSYMEIRKLFWPY